jgi:hypothetical protein
MPGVRDGLAALITELEVAGSPGLPTASRKHHDRIAA